MTLIVGIRCKAGIVVGADGAATYAAGTQFTAKQPSEKLSIHHKRVVVGTAGQIGVGQRINDVVRSLWAGNTFSDKNPAQAGRIIQGAVAGVLKGDYDVFNSLAPSIGPAMLPATDTLVALPVSHEPCLFTVDSRGMTEEADLRLPTVAIGSGQVIADPFLAFLRRVLWRDEVPPNVGACLFGALWTLEHAIKSSPGFLAEPVQIVTLEHVGGEWTARQLEEAELEEHRQAIKAAEDRLATFPDAFSSGEQASSPPPIPLGHQSPQQR